jgi:hypothetical protein
LPATEEHAEVGIPKTVACKTLDQRKPDMHPSAIVGSDFHVAILASHLTSVTARRSNKALPPTTEIAKARVPFASRRRPVVHDPYPQGWATAADEDLEDIMSNNIITPDRELSDGGPLQHSHRRGASMTALLDNMREKAHTAPQSTLSKAIEPAGPNALRALCNNIDPILLARLSQFGSLKFSEHTKPLGFVRLRLLVGIYSQKTMAQWDEDVHVYLKPLKVYLSVVKVLD